jgi:hypothetical protein
MAKICDDTAMNTKRFITVLSLCSVLGVSACVSTPVETRQDIQERAAEEIRVALPRDEVSSVLASGLYNVSERALTPVNVHDLGLEGMRGLATIDPEISVTENRGVIEVRYGGEFVKAVVKPLAADSESWADAIYDVLIALWPLAPDLAQTNPERIYEAVFDAALSNLDIFSRYAGKLIIHPLPIIHLNEIFARAAIGPVHGSIVITVHLLFHFSWIAIAIGTLYHDKISRLNRRYKGVGMG